MGVASPRAHGEHGHKESHGGHGHEKEGHRKHDEHGEDGEHGHEHYNPLVIPPGIFIFIFFKRLVNC